MKNCIIIKMCFYLLVFLLFACGPSAEEKGAQEKATIDSAAAFDAAAEAEAKAQEQELQLALDSLELLSQQDIAGLSKEQQVMAYIRLLNKYDVCKCKEKGCYKKLEFKISGVAASNIKLVVFDTVISLNSLGIVQANIFVPKDSVCINVLITGEDDETKFEGRVKIGDSTKIFSGKTEKYLHNSKLIYPTAATFAIKNCHQIIKYRENVFAKNK